MQLLLRLQNDPHTWMSIVTFRTHGGRRHDRGLLHPAHALSDMLMLFRLRVTIRIRASYARKQLLKVSFGCLLAPGLLWWPYSSCQLLLPVALLGAHELVLERPGAEQ